MIKNTFILFFMVCALVFKSSCRPTPSTCVIDLDKDPKDRWAACVNEHIAGIKRLNDIVRVNPMLDSQALLQKLAPIAQNPEIYLEREMAEEIKGIAQASQQKLDTMLMFATIFEALSGCSVAVIEADDGSIYMARNTDFFPPELKELLISVEFQRQKKTIFKGISFAGYPGILVGFADQRLGATLNQRLQDYDAISSDLSTPAENAIEKILRNKEQMDPKKRTKFITWSIRQALQQGLNYDEAKKEIGESEYFTTAGYITLIGTKKGEGVTFVRNSYKNPQIPYEEDDGKSSLSLRYTLNKKIDLLNPNNDGYIFQTNNDTCSFCLRCRALKNSIENIGKSNIEVNKLFEALKEPPVYVEDGDYRTIHSTIMNPQKDIFETKYY